MFIAVGLFKILVGVFVEEYGHPLTQRTTTHSTQQEWATRLFLEVGTIRQFCTILQHIGRYGTQEATEAIGCCTQVVGSQTFFVLFALQVKTSLSLCQLLVPAMQLGEIIEAAIRVGKFANALFKLLGAEFLPLFQLLTQYFTNLIGCVRFAQVVGSLAIEVIEHLIAQRT